MGGGLRKSDVGSQMSDKRRLTVNSRRLTVNGKRLTVLVISLILLISFVTVAIATGFFGTNTTKISSLEKGLVAHYPLDGVHQTKDTTPYGNHGTNNGATLSTGRKGEANGAYSFDGTDDYISLDSNLQITSVSMWINLWNVTNVAYFLGDSVNKNGIRYNGSSFLAYSGGSIWGELNWTKVNRMVHLGIVRVDNTGYYDFYVDGIKIGTSYGGNNNNIIIDTIGRRESQYYFNGSMSDVRFYNRALSDDEIKLLYDSFQPKFSTTNLHKGLVLDVDMNDVEDRSPNAYDFTMVGNTSATPDRKGINRAKAFDGNDAYYNTNFKDSYLTDFTYTVWAKYTGDNSSVYRYFCAGGSGTTGHQAGFGIRNNKIFISAYKLPIVYGTDLIDDVKDWHLYTMVYSDGTASIYIDDNLYEDLTINLDVQGSNFVIGGLADLNGNFLGDISSVKVYNRQLSVDEITLLYNSYKPKEASVGSLNKGLVLDMPLTTKHMKSATVVSDRTPYGNDGTVYGATVGSDSTSFDGVDDYIDLGVDSSLDLPIVSISIWFKTSNTTEMKIFKTSATFTNKYGVTMNDPGYMTIITSDADYINFQTNSLYNDNIWHHFVGITNPSLSENKVYIDGELAEGGQITETLVGIGDYTRISGRPPSSYNFDGSISNLKIYNRALSAEEVKLLYEKSKGSE